MAESFALEIGDLVRKAGEPKPLMHIYDWDKAGNVAKCNYVIADDMLKRDVFTHELVFVARGKKIQQLRAK